jgi:type III pantothenate kinase
MVVASVVPHLVPVFFEALRGVSDATPLLVSPRLKLGVKIGYKTPETLGADRLAGASAAYSAYGGPVAVVDFGTATTFSVVDKDGTFLGGAIAPGLLTGYDALTEKAAGVPRVGLTFPKNAIGMSTGEGVQSGVIFGHAAMVHGMLEKFAAELEWELRTVVTGGLAKTLAPHIKVAHEVEPHLTLKGLAAIYRLNA